MKITVILLAVLIVLAVLYIRLAPSDPARWHIDIADPAFEPDPNWAVFCPPSDSRYGLATDLAANEAQAMNWPRTKRLAGSVQEGRITWITRSAVFGFPDYTTAALREDNGQMLLCIVARQRFGKLDGGVNARRIQAWVQSAYGLNEVPDLIWHTASP